MLGLVLITCLFLFIPPNNPIIVVAVITPLIPKRQLRLRDIV